MASDIEQPVQKRAVRDGIGALRATLELVPVGIAHFDSSGRFIMVNERLCAIMGYDRAELLRRTFQEVTFEDDLVECLRLNAELAAGVIPSYRREKRFVRADGSVVWVSVTASAVRDETGAVAFFVGVADDITEQHAAEERRRQSGERLEAALEASRTGTFRWDIPSGDLWWDANLYRLMGRTPREGRFTIEDSLASVHPDDRPRLGRAVARCAAEGGAFSEEFRVVHPDGSVEHLRCIGRTLPDAQGRPAYMTGAATDITLAAKATRMRDEMVAVVAHDLRDPLQSLAMGAGLLAQQSLGAERRASIAQMISRTVDGMQRLLGDLLDVSRMDAGTLVVVRGPIRVAPLLDAVRERFEARFRERSLVLRCECAPDVTRIDGDHDRLVQALSHLVGNALKFSRPPGEVHVRVQRDGAHARFSVRDCGPGIDPKDIPRLFERFRQRDPGAAGGAGLGLAIAKGIVAAHSGRIWVENNPGGTTFFFTLPG